MNATAATAALDEAKSQWIRAVATLTQTLAVIGNSPKAVTIRFPNCSCLYICYLLRLRVGYFWEIGTSCGAFYIGSCKRTLSYF